ncbi:MAG: methyltransferase domain-containing protein [Acidobacteriaceae bacterium]|nr:methyltransferase domain-containing protein [Acidobacteriaceae bacterium]
MIEAPPIPTNETPPLPGFDHRTYALHEHLDGPCTYADYRKAMLDMARLNRFTRAHRPFLQLIAEVVAKTGVSHTPLAILDIGCGQGALLRIVRRWAATRSLPLRLTGIDLHPYAARLAAECNSKEHLPPGTLHHETADALATAIDADIIFCSLMAHHLTDDDVLRLLHQCNRARHAWMISDLRRSQRAAKLFVLLARLLRLHRFVVEDGDISFRRAYSLEEWKQLVTRANIRAEVIDVGSGRVLIRKQNVEG